MTAPARTCIRLVPIAVTTNTVGEEVRAMVRKYGLLICAPLALIACGKEDIDTETLPLGKMVHTEDGFRWDLDPFEVEAGKEIQRCVVLEGVDEDVVIETANTTQSAGGHHLIIFTGINAVPGTVVDCTTAASMANFRFIAPGVFHGGLDNTAFKIPKGKPIILQSHYVNASTKPIEAVDSYTVKKVAAGAAPKLVDFFAFTDVEFKIPVGAKSITHTCTMDKDLQVLEHSGHMHEFGTHYTMEHLIPGQEPIILDSYEWNADYRDQPMRHSFTADAPMIVRAGESLRMTCAWENPKGREIEFPEEMCAAFFHYLTSEDRPGGFLSCFEGTPEVEEF
jgi:hypothetical protein